MKKLYLDINNDNQIFFDNFNLNYEYFNKQKGKLLRE